MKKIVIAMVAALAAGACWGWGDAGHSAVAEIAQRRVNAATQAQVAALLGTHGSLASIASWADDVRDARPETSAWHYVNVPLSQSRYLPARDCQASDRGDCVVAALGRLQQEMRCGATPQQRSEALRFAVHLVGDIHQPLHAMDAMRGGNLLNVVTAFKGVPQASNLHAVWDSGLVSATAGSWGALVSLVEKDWLGAAEAAAVIAAPGSPQDWANESHAAAQQIWKSTPETNRLDDKYLQAMSPILIRQIGRAGVRLAAYLDRAFASAACPVAQPQ